LNQLPADDVTAAIMATQDWSRVWIFLEGDADWDTIKTYITENHVQALPMPHGSGKQQVIEIVKELNEYSLPGINYFGIIDLDFDKLLGTQEDVENLFHTESHDLDLDIILAGALARFFDTHISEDLLLNFAEKTTRQEANSSIIEKIMNSAAEFGLVRLACYITRTPQSDCKVRKYCLSDLKPILDDLIEVIENKYSQANIRNIVETERAKNHSDQYLSNGHDVLEIVVILLGTTSKKSCSGLGVAKVDSIIKGCFSLEHFRNLQLYRIIQTWERTNSRPVLIDS
jgi:hypothetical protein